MIYEWNAAMIYFHTTKYILEHINRSASYM